MFSFQGLDTAQFIIADDPLTLLSQLDGLMVQLINVAVFGLKLIILFVGQPVTDLMWFEIGFFLKDVRHDAAISAQQCPV